MNVDEEKANTITKYRISEEQVIGNAAEKESNYDLVTVVMLRLGPAEKAADKPILRLLDVLLSAETKPEEKKAILEKDFDIPMSASMSEEANIMCNLGEGIREQAAINTRVQSIIDLMDSLGIDAERAMPLFFLFHIVVWTKLAGMRSAPRTHVLVSSAENGDLGSIFTNLN